MKAEDWIDINLRKPTLSGKWILIWDGKESDRVFCSSHPEYNKKWTVRALFWANIEPPKQ